MTHTKDYRGSGAEKYLMEPTGYEIRERQSPPNEVSGN
jgi:hypothetical protein